MIIFDSYLAMDTFNETYFSDRLWKKEKNCDNFVDLLPPLPSETWNDLLEVNHSAATHKFRDMRIDPVKNDDISNEFRDAGNQLFKAKEWRAAMEYYNQSLRFAENGSDSISLAYANRSACFLRMKKYIQCLNDIVLAKENNYPKRLMQKLNDRETQCLEQMAESDSDQGEIEPKLSFPPDRNFPCLANVLAIQYSKKFGRHIVARHDIGVGETVLIEEPFSFAYNAIDRTLCSTCLKHMKNFIPCCNCVDAMFCNKNCLESNAIHAIACGAPLYRLPGISLSAQTIITILNAFDTIEDLMGKYILKRSIFCFAFQMSIATNMFYLYQNSSRRRWPHQRQSTRTIASMKSPKCGIY